MSVFIAILVGAFLGSILGPVVFVVLMDWKVRRDIARESKKRSH